MFAFLVAQLLAAQWLWQYNNERPNSAVGGVPPAQLLQVGWFSTYKGG
ncbi:hypothetical protein GTQ55_12275 [Microbulbifer hydrolyticus]|uniref:Integrase catalytic domain-containing protein n=1 Tax=Microbulbifer hydrolyticus TaxID=48074 RepID=A0ABX6J1K7_9GAMM|nr:hypothetical protein GTQ55_12275 [Microbulbifer hydrolyticus]